MDDQRVNGPVTPSYRVELLRRVMRGAAGSEDEAMKQAFDMLGLFDTRVLKITGSVMRVLRREGVL